MSAFYTNVAIIGDNVLFRGVKDGKRLRKKVHYNPKFYVKSNTPTKWQTLNKEYVEEKVFKSIREARNFIDEFKDVDNFEVYGSNRYEYAFISDIFPEEIDWDLSQICVAYIDIEVGSENGFPEPSKATEEVTAITLSMNGRNYVFGCGEFNNTFESTEYIKCQDEFELIEKFIDKWTLYYPDIISGWNVRFFDFPYLINRITRLFGEDKATKLSPWGKVTSSEINFRGKKQICYELYGISILDYYELYRKYSANPNQESYKLDHICSVELGERKLDYSEYENLHQLYRLDYQKFIEYNIRDVELVQKLEDKIRLIELAMTLAYDAKVNYDDVFSQVRMWDTITYNTLKAKHMVIPPRRNAEKDSQYAGAFVKDPILGMHEWVASFDLNSLYPHLIMQYNLSPEMLIEPKNYTEEMRKFMAQWGSKINVDSLLAGKIPTEELKKLNVTITPNGQLFDISKQGFLSEIMERMYEDRAMYKNKATEAKKLLEKSVSESEKRELEKQIAKFNNIQLAKKVTLNSAYGAIGNQYFRFFDIRIAEAITLSGQLSIRWIENKLNDYINKIVKTRNADYVIASDTDSIYLNLGPLIKKSIPNIEKVEKLKIIRAMDQFCDQKLQPYIDASYQELSEYVNAYAQKMKMKREALADKAIWTAKKRYLINVYNNEGVEYKKPKLKIMGLEAVKSSTPNACREKIKEALQVILTKDQETLIQFIANFRKEFKTLPVEDVAFPRSVNGVREYADKNSVYAKGTPIHVKGALIFNNAIRTKNLEKKYQEIKEGEKIKFLYVKEPNPLQCSVISFLTTIPKEFDLGPYLDYDTQFEKSFLDPLTIVLDSINWKSEKTNSLDDFFS
jgi:DNA polymerase elongation subunit (family B)